MTLPEAPMPRSTEIGVQTTVAGYASLLDSERSRGRTVGVVPTMGALHAGHRALIERAAAECDVVAVTVFVNPTQFGDPSDLVARPKPLVYTRHEVALKDGAAVKPNFPVAPTGAGK